MRHPIEIAKEKFAKDMDITVCAVVTVSKVEGVIYKGEFFEDFYLLGCEGEEAYVIEDEDGAGISLFTPAGMFAKWFKRGAGVKAKAWS